MTSFASLRRAAVVAFALGAALAGAARAEGSWFGASTVTGSGKAASEQRLLAGFQAVAIKGSVDVVLRQAAKESVEVRADDNLLPLIETTVADRDGVPTLEVATKKGTRISTRSKITVTVDLPTLKAISISGSGEASGDKLQVGDLQVRIVGAGDVRLRQLSAESLGVKISGNGDVQATGRAARLTVAISGSGDVLTRELDADDVSVSIAGSGDARVNARKTLAVSIAGSGDVAYTGDASVKTSIAGSGNVRKL